ncbi:MAG: sigma-70 family RNA polymerase sigma factor [Prevotella sp.]|jgi:RNA polymerase sigma-70 factor (ECF subfamily)|nr:sigma-70 family RNA polymerase sigma factor [Prevotella sp.]
MDDQMLVAECKRGKPWAQKKLYELYAPVMMGICMRYASDRDTAQDILQDGFVKVFTKLDMYTGKGSLEGWMRRVFVTTALEYLRQNNALKFSVSIDEYTEVVENVSVSALDKLSADELMKCIEQLPSGYRTIFNLFAIEGYSHNEIAEILNIQESTSRSQFIRGRKLLQKIVLSQIMQEDAKRQRG